MMDYLKAGAFQFTQLSEQSTTRLVSTLVSWCAPFFLEGVKLNFHHQDLHKTEMNSFSLLIPVCNMNQGIIANQSFLAKSLVRPASHWSHFFPIPNGWVPEPMTRNLTAGLLKENIQ